MESPSLGFGLEFAGKLVYVEVFAFEGFYQMLFNSKPIGAIEYTENFSWCLTSGQILPQSIVNEMGFRIETFFE